MQYYLGGYYLIRRRPIDFGTLNSKIVFTCSNCINDSLLDHWSYSWTTNNNALIEDIKNDCQLSQDDIGSIREWVDDAFNNNRIGWINLFYDLDVVKEYYKKFFSHLSDVQIIGVYFSTTEINDILVDLKTLKDGSGAIGLYENLSKMIPETESEEEVFIGYDVVGIEWDGGFHTFYCHDISKDLVDKFKLEINEYGLFKEKENWAPITEYMNDQENGFKSVPWFVCKEKLVKEQGGRQYDN